MEYNLSRSPLLIVLSAPSGGGKSTILQALLGLDDNLRYSMSATSRPPRPSEVDGHHYDFLTQEEFEYKINNGEFLEYAVVYKHLYGTLKIRVEELFNQNHDVIMDLDFQGGLNVKKQLPNSVLIFIMPPSLAVLEERLVARGQDSSETIALRLRNAEKECDHAAQYDYIVLNENLDQTIDSIAKIIQAERSRACRVKIDKQVETGQLQHGDGN